MDTAVWWFMTCLLANGFNEIITVGLQVNMGTSRQGIWVFNNTACARHLTWTPPFPSYLHIPRIWCSHAYSLSLAPWSSHYFECPKSMIVTPSHSQGYFPDGYPCGVCLHNEWTVKLPYMRNRSHHLYSSSPRYPKARDAPSTLQRCNVSCSPWCPQ